MTARRTGQAGLSVLIVLVATCAAVGWLYVLRHADGLAAGPRVGGALPLQRLAGDAAQPLLRFAVAWLPAGLLSGAVLARAASSLSAPARAALAGATTLVALLAAGAVSDAVTANETVRAHLTAQASHGATWLAVAVVAVSALVAAPPARERAR
jgi:hypothetical protein